MKNLWRDESGGVISLELILVSTVLGGGVIAGMSGVRDAINEQMANISSRIRSLEDSLSVQDQEEAELEGDACIVTCESSRFTRGYFWEPNGDGTVRIIRYFTDEEQRALEEDRPLP